MALRGAWSLFIELNIQFWLFLLLQLVFSALSDPANHQYRMTNALVATACCVIVLALWLFFLEILKWTFASYYLTSRLHGGALLQHIRGVFLVNSRAECGLVLFVLAYSIHGMQWLPQTTAFIALLLMPVFAAFQHRRQWLVNLQDNDGVGTATTTTILSSAKKRRNNRRKSLKEFCLLFIPWCLLLVFDCTVLRDEFRVHDLWFGCVLPFSSIVWLCCFLGEQQHNNAEEEEEDQKSSSGAHRVLFPALLPMTLLSISILSVCMPAQECASELGALTGGPRMDNNGSGAVDTMGLLMMPRGEFDHYAGNNTTAAATLPGSFLFLLFPENSTTKQYFEQTAQFIANKTNMYYRVLTIPSNFFGFGTVPIHTEVSLLALFAAPMLLWSALRLVIERLSQGRLQGVMAVWLLSSVAKNMVQHGPAIVLLILILLFVKASLLWDAFSQIRGDTCSPDRRNPYNTNTNTNNIDNIEDHGQSNFSIDEDDLIIAVGGPNEEQGSRTGGVKQPAI